jgi:hypothetical protein
MLEQTLEVVAVEVPSGQKPTAAEFELEMVALEL